MRSTVRRLVAGLLRTSLVFGTTVGLVAAGSAGSQAGAEREYELGYTQVVVAPAVYDLIVGAGITPSVVGPATAFPFEGTLATRYPISQLQVENLRIKHDGGVRLTAGDATILLKRFWIDVGRLRVSAVVRGSIGEVGRVDLFKLRLSDDPDLGLVGLTLTDTAAGALNATFGVDAFAEDATFGYATPRLFGDIDERRADTIMQRLERLSR